MEQTSKQMGYEDDSEKKFGEGDRTPADTTEVRAAWGSGWGCGGGSVSFRIPHISTSPAAPLPSSDHNLHLGLPPCEDPRRTKDPHKLDESEQPNESQDVQLCRELGTDDRGSYKPSALHSDGNRRKGKDRNQVNEKPGREVIVKDLRVICDPLSAIIVIVGKEKLQKEID